MLRCRFDVVTDKGTFDAVGLSADARQNRRLYTESVAALLRPRSLLVITSCNSTRGELVQHFCGSYTAEQALGAHADDNEAEPVLSPRFAYVEHVLTYPTFRYGGVEGSKVCTVAFRRL